MTVECSLTILCLRYLTFPCFQEETDGKLHGYARGGYFVLQDYAIAKWTHHIRTLVQAGGKLFTGEPGNQSMLEDLEQALDDFLNVYQGDFSDEQMLPNARLKNDCEPFRAYEVFYENLLPIWDHILKHEESGLENRDKVSMNSLALSLERSRRILEEISGDEDLRQFYGTNLFKCHKLTCFRFHEGFTDPRSRKLHVKKHDRPYNCQVPDCDIAEFGFVTQKDLDKHMRTYHEELCDPDESFSLSSDKAFQKTPYVCNICSAKFTRNFNLISHLRVHKGERPFTCTECGKAFARSSDCERHKKIHARRR